MQSRANSQQAATVRQAYNAGRNNQPFWAKQGSAVVNIGENEAYIEAADGGRAQVYLPRQTEVVERKVFVPQEEPLFKRRSTWCIILLVLVILLMAGGVATGVAVHEINKNNSNAAQAY